jgi:hypothetical protein
MKLVILRTFKNERQTLGTGIVYNDQGRTLIQFNTLELPYLNNRSKISCINAGVYTIVKRRSERFGTHFLVKNVKDRSLILIHHGNFYTQTEGCILVGSELKDLNNDNLLDVVNSKKTMNLLVEVLGVSTELRIIDNF